MFDFIIEYVNNYGHVVHSIKLEKKTERQAIITANKNKFYYPECYIEILNLNTLKRIYK